MTIELEYMVGNFCWYTFAKIMKIEGINLHDFRSKLHSKMLTDINIFHVSFRKARW